MSKIETQIPTEILLDIFLHIARSDLSVFTLTCSVLFAVAQPLLFQRVSVLMWGTERTVPFVDAMERHPRLAQMIRVLNLGQCFSSRSFGLVKRLLSVTTRVDELLIAGHTYGMTGAFLGYPPELFCNIRRIRCCVDSDEFFAKFIQSLPSLRCLQVDYVGRGVAESTNLVFPLEGSAKRVLDQLMKYCGPAFVLQSLSPDSHIRHITSLEPVTMPILRHLGHVVGNQLESLHLQQENSGRFHIYDHHCLPHTLLPSLFPNLQSVAWLSITLSVNDRLHSQDTAPSSPNSAVLSALEQLPRLRRVWFVAQYKEIHDKDTLQSFLDALTNAAATTQQPLEFIFAYTCVAGPGEACTYIKYHEGPLEGPPRDVWRMYEYAPILTCFDLETEISPILNG